MNQEDRADKKKAILTYHRIIEAFKFGYAWRPLLGDMDFEDVTQVSTRGVRGPLQLVGM